METNFNLKHYNKAELLYMLGNNEQNIEFLMDKYFEDVYKYIKKLREAVKHNDLFAYNHFVRTIAESSKSVCFELMYKMASELETFDLNNKVKIKESIDELENELENVKDILLANEV